LREVAYPDGKRHECQKSLKQDAYVSPRNPAGSRDAFARRTWLTGVIERKGEEREGHVMIEGSR
jgi:hypothetical protein